LDVAVDLGGWFLKKGSLIVSEEGRDGNKQEMRASGNEVLADIPVVVLVNSGSASASEILAGALKDDRQAPLVGEKTFGKGTVQELENLSDGSSMKLTIAHWVLPSGHILDHDGINPDYVVKISDDDIKNKRDPQLDKALEIIKTLIK
jgi:carboxyl-terminal processing protease